MAMTIGLRELKNNLGATVRRVRRGETVQITDRNRPIAEIRPVQGANVTERLRQLVGSGRVSWSGGKPAGSSNPPTLRRKTVSAAVVEDRR